MQIQLDIGELGCGDDLRALYIRPSRLSHKAVSELWKRKGTLSGKVFAPKSLKASLNLLFSPASWTLIVMRVSALGEILAAMVGFIAILK